MCFSGCTYIVAVMNLVLEASYKLILEVWGSSLVSYVVSVSAKNFGVAVVACCV
jgi:hypothetical protein